mmetsp:Transcript_117415/g.339463  ORF Transcript_117415/g.339463 Transcript_117415/m.339463 type:complete len:507 (-) Transcript_117415:2125-3645(-)
MAGHAGPSAAMDPCGNSSRLAVGRWSADTSRAPRSKAATPLRRRQGRRQCPSGRLRNARGPGCPRPGAPSHPRRRGRWALPTGDLAAAVAAAAAAASVTRAATAARRRRSAVAAGRRRPPARRRRVGVPMGRRRVGRAAAVRRRGRLTVGRHAGHRRRIGAIVRWRRRRAPWRAPAASPPFVPAAVAAPPGVPAVVAAIAAGVPAVAAAAVPPVPGSALVPVPAAPSGIAASAPIPLVAAATAVPATRVTATVAPPRVSAAAAIPPPGVPAAGPPVSPIPIAGGGRRRRRAVAAHTCAAAIAAVSAAALRGVARAGRGRPAGRISAAIGSAAIAPLLLVAAVAALLVTAIAALLVAASVVAAAAASPVVTPVVAPAVAPCVPLEAEHRCLVAGVVSALAISPVVLGQPHEVVEGGVLGKLRLQDAALRRDLHGVLDQVKKLGVAVHAEGARAEVLLVVFLEVVRQVGLVERGPVGVVHVHPVGVDEQVDLESEGEHRPILPSEVGE